MGKHNILVGVIGLVVGIGIGAAGIYFYPPALSKDTNRMSYAVGRQIGMGIKNEGIDLNPRVIGLAIQDVLDNNKSRMSDEELGKAMNGIQMAAQKKIAAEGEKNLQAGQEFLKQNAQKEGVKTLPNGVQILVTKEGKGKTPKAESTVVINYTGRLITGQTFDSSEKSHKPAEFKLNQIIPGLSAALQQMKEGSSSRVFIPPSLAYGQSPRPGIPGQSVLVFDVDLLKVK